MSETGISESMAQRLMEQQQEIINRQRGQTNAQSAAEIIEPDEIIEERPNVYTNKIAPNSLNTPESGTLGRAKRFEEREAIREERHQSVVDMQDTFGWLDLPVQYLPTQGAFYPIDTKISIRSALVQEIRNFSIIDETDLIDIDDKLNMIVDKCCRIIFEGRRVTYKEILEVDRFYIVYSIRELTFKDGENKLQMNINCNECGHSDMIDIKKQNFNFYAMPDKLERFYNREEAAFVMTLKETGEKIKIYLPKLGVTNFIKHYIRKKRQQQQNLDMAFLNIAPFLFEDWQRLNDTTYAKLMQDSFSWSIKKMSIIINVIDLIKSAINPQIKHICTACSAEVQAPLSFPDGIKSLFLYTVDTSGDFFDSLV
jgi:hypothetical protein